MTHTRAFRALTAVLSVWLGICLAQPMQLHLCVMHGGLAIDARGHAAHMSHSSVSHDAQRSTPGHQQSQQCSCLGDCTTGSPPAFVVAAPVVAPLPAVDRLVASSAIASTLITATDLALPFSNGPPATSSRTS